MAVAARTGDFGHALHFLVPELRQWEVYSWPAQRSDGFAGHPAPEGGCRFRIDPTLDVASVQGRTPFAQAVARTAQRYGMVLADEGGAVAIATNQDRELLQCPRRATIPARVSRVGSETVVIATGVSADGCREVLGCPIGDSETTDSWTEFLRGLRERDLGGVQLVTSDHHARRVLMPHRILKLSTYSVSATTGTRRRRPCVTGRSWPERMS